MSNRNPSQAAVILDYLQGGEALTAIDALNQFGCFRLAARIYELRRDGHDIEEQMIERGGKRYASYFLRTFSLKAA